MWDIIFKSPKTTEASQYIGSWSVLFQEQPNEVCMHGALLPALINFGWCLISVSDCQCIHFISQKHLSGMPAVFHPSSIHLLSLGEIASVFKWGLPLTCSQSIYLAGIFLSLFHPELRCGHGSNHSTSYLKPLKWLVQRYTSRETVAQGDPPKDQLPLAMAAADCEAL